MTKTAGRSESKGAMIGYRPIRRDFGNPTGLSMRDGDPVESVDELPGHRVVAHVFRGADEAAAFVAGMEIFGQRNAVDHCWHVGDTVSNGIVLVAYFDEPRPDVDDPADAVEIVVHKATGHDGRAIAKGNAESVERNEAARRETQRKAEPVQIALRDAGIGVDAPGSEGGGVAYRGSYSFVQGGERFSANWSVDGGPYDLTMSVSSLRQYDLDSVPILREVCEARGIVFDPDEMDVRVEGIAAPEGIPVALELIREAEKEWEAMRKAAFEARFRASVKLTAARRRFLKSGAEHGIRHYVNRADAHLKAGVEDITRTEIEVLRRMRWIEAVDGRTWRVTDEGRAAVGLATVAPDAADPDEVDAPSGPRM